MPTSGNCGVYSLRHFLNAPSVLLDASVSGRARVCQAGELLFSWLHPNQLNGLEKKPEFLSQWIRSMTPAQTQNMPLTSHRSMRSNFITQICSQKNQLKFKIIIVYIEYFLKLYRKLRCCETRSTCLVQNSRPSIKLFKLLHFLLWYLSYILIYTHIYMYKMQYKYKI